MLVECKNCGAPLDVNGVERFIRCSYCDKVNRVRTMRTMAFQTPPQWQPPQTWQPPPQFGPFRPYQYHRVSSPIANRIPLIILGFVVMTSLVGIVPILVSTMLGRASPTRSGADSAPVLALHIDELMRSSPLGAQARTGERAAVVTGRADCAGYIPAQPQLIVRTHRPDPVAIIPSSEETVLVLQRASGDYLCGAAGQPITGVLPHGRHSLWVGSSRDGGTSSVTLTFRTTLPADRLRPHDRPTLGLLDDRRMDLGAGALHSGTAEGVVAVSELGAGCRGSVPRNPQLVIDLVQARPVALAFERHVDELVVLVRSSRGAFICQTVAPGEPSAFPFDLPFGRSQVWIGVADLAARGEYSVAVRAAEWR